MFLLNVTIETPADHFLMIAARSSTHKKGLMMANGVGIIDPDYSGNEDEVKVAYYNFTDAAVIIEKGERIAQGAFIKITHPEWEELMRCQTRRAVDSGRRGINKVNTYLRAVIRNSIIEHFCPRRRSESGIFRTKPVLTLARRNARSFLMGCFLRCCADQ